MDKELFIIIIILLSILKGFALYNYSNIFYNIKKNSDQIQIISVIMSLSTFAVYLMYSVISMIAVDIIIILLLYIKSDNDDKIISTIKIALIFIIVEFSVLLLFLESEIVLNNNLVLMALLSNIVLYIISLNLKEIYSTFEVSLISHRNTFIIIFVPIALLYMLSIIIQISNINIIQILLSFILVLLIDIFMMYLYKSLKKEYEKRILEVKLKEQNCYYAEQLKLFSKSNDEIRAMKHDMKNELIVLHSLIESNHESDIEKATAYISSILNENILSDKFVNTGNVNIDSIINYKYKEALKENIDVELDLQVPSEINLNPFDITAVLGNLLDNAIEATKKIIDDKWIKINIIYNKGNIWIQVTNPYIGDLIVENQFLKTKKLDKRNHGYGIRNVKMVVEKNNGTMHMNYLNNIFDVRISLEI